MAIGLSTSGNMNLPHLAGASPSSADRFKTRENSVSLSSSPPGEKYQLRTCRCWSRACEHCAPVLGRRVQGKLLAGVEGWKNPRMMTMTVDRSKFASPQAAYREVMERRYLPRLMEALGVVRWVRVLEFQMKTGDGWPHWHVLADATGSKGRVDLKMAWRLWRDTWGVGGLDLSNNERLLGRPVRDIIKYLCKYMVKFPEKGFPKWVLELSNVRFVQGSRSVGALVCGGRDEQVPEEEEIIVVPGSPEDVSKKRKSLFARSIRERIAGCGEVSSLFGHKNEKYISRIPVRVGQVAIAAKMGFIEGVTFEVQDDGYGKTFLGIVLERLGGESIEEMLYRVEEGVRLLQHVTGSHQIAPLLQTREGDNSKSASEGCAIVIGGEEIWVPWENAAQVFMSEWEAVQSAIAEPTDAYLWELIEQEEERSVR